MRIFDEAQTRAALPFERLIPALRARFAQGCEVPSRHVHEIAASDGAPGLTSLLMPAWIAGGCYGVKIVNIAPANAARGLPGLHATYTLFDATTGVPLALLDGGEITARRTAAASALATQWLARTDACRLLVVGAGRVAALLPDAYCAVRTIERVTVWARSVEKAQSLAAAWRTAGLDAESASDLGAAVAAADIVSCATLASEPLVRGEWLPPGCHLDLVGGFTPTMREADDEAVRRARIFVDTREGALHEAGDLVQPIAAGVITRADIVGDLFDLARGTVPGRESNEEITYFKSVGTALEDLAAAELVVQRL